MHTRQCEFRSETTFEQTRHMPQCVVSRSDGTSFSCGFIPWRAKPGCVTSHCLGQRCCGPTRKLELHVTFWPLQWEEKRYHWVPSMCQARCWRLPSLISGLPCSTNMWWALAVSWTVSLPSFLLFLGSYLFPRGGHILLSWWVWESLHSKMNFSTQGASGTSCGG